MSFSAASLKKRRYIQSAGYFASVAGFGALMSAFGPVLPTLAMQTATDLGRMGLIFTFRALGFFAGSLLGGRLFDRLPANPVLGGAMLGQAAMFSLIPLMQSFGGMLPVALLMGFAGGALLVGSNTLIVWVHEHNVGPWMNALSFFSGLGGFIAPLVVAGSLGMRYGFWAMAVVIGLAGVAVLFVPSPEIRKSQDESGADNRIPYGLVLAFAMVFLLYVGAEVTFSGWLYTFSISLHPQAVQPAAWITSAFYAAIAVGRLLAIPISSRLRPRTILAIDFAGALASLLVLATLSKSLAAVWAGSIGLGLFVASLFSTWMVFVDRRVTITGKINGIYFAATAVGGMIFPWLAGRMFDLHGPVAIMLVVVGVVLSAAVIFAVTTGVSQPRKNGKADE